MKPIQDENKSLSNVITTNSSVVLEMQGCKQFSVHSVIDVNTPEAVTFLSGESEVSTLTFLTQENTDDGDYVVVYDTTGKAWAVAADLSGESEGPTGAVWAAIPSAQKALADISAATTAAEVAACFELAFDGITGFSDVITSDDSAADGTMLMTQVVRGPVTNPVLKNTDDSTVGTITSAETNAGVTSTVNVTSNVISIAEHGLTTGLKVQLTTDGTLPAGIELATDYFIVVVDGNSIKLASSLANAIASTPVVIDITDQGSDGATNIITCVALAGATVKSQISNDNVNWVDKDSAVNITADANNIFYVVDPYFKYFRLNFTISAGRFSADNHCYLQGRKN